MQLEQAHLAELHYIIPLENLPSVVRLGILSHERARSVIHRSVASPSVQQRRASRIVPGGRRLHDYVNLYIDARNPMMYVLKDQHLNLCVLRVSTAVLGLPHVVVADGNAAGAMTRFGPAPEGLALINRDLVMADWWSDNDETKRVRCAEVLVPDHVPPEYFLGIHVSCGQAEKNFNVIALPEPRLAATVHEHLFYLGRGG